MTPSWYEQAACQGVDTNYFYPEVGGTTYSIVQRICMGCDVRMECLQAGMSEEHGIWGGLHPDARRRLKRGISA
jgi:WhiB family redox-sensing transcriptional regulator